MIDVWLLEDNATYRRNLARAWTRVVRAFVET